METSIVQLVTFGYPTGHSHAFNHALAAIVGLPSGRCLTRPSIGEKLRLASTTFPASFRFGSAPHVPAPRRFLLDRAKLLGRILGGAGLRAREERRAGSRAAVCVGSAWRAYRPNRAEWVGVGDTRSTQLVLVTH